MSISSTLRFILSWFWSIWNTGFRVFLIGMGHIRYGIKNLQIRQPISDMIREGWYKTIKPNNAADVARGYSWWFFVSGVNTCLVGLILFLYIRTNDTHSRPALILFALFSIPLSILGVLAQPETGWWLLTIEALYVLYANFKNQCSSQMPTTATVKKNK